MAYQLVCPSCQERVNSPFVRVGAMVRCGSCGHTYRVQESQVMRSIAPPAKPEYVQAIRKQAEDPGEDEPVTLSGLSDLMQREAGPTRQASGSPLPAGRPAPRRANAAGAQSGVGPGGGVAGGGRTTRRAAEPGPDAESNTNAPVIERLRQVQRRRRITAVATGIGTAALALGIVTILWIVPTMRSEAPPDASDAGAASPGTIEPPGAAPPPLDPADAADDDEATADASPAVAETLAFEPLLAPEWEEFETPRELAMPIEVGVRVEQARQRFSPEHGILLEVAVTNQTGGLVARAEVTVALLNPDGPAAIARRRAGLAVLEPGETRYLALPMPERFRTRRPRVEAWVERHQPLTDAWPAAAEVEVEAAEAAAADRLRLRFTNDASRAAAAAVVALEAVNPRGDVLAAWIGRRDRPVEPGRSVELATPPPAIESVLEPRWRARGVLIPGVEAPASGSGRVSGSAPASGSVKADPPRSDEPS